MLNRRGLITGLISFVAAPAIVRAASLMPIKVFDKTWYVCDWGDDCWPGTANQPFYSFWKAMSATAPGDTVYIGGAKLGGGLLQ